MLSHDEIRGELGRLGRRFLDRLGPERLTRYYVKHLERLGHKLTLETIAA
jgi:hypothetical protein